MEIRLARVSDVPELLEIYRPYIEDTTVTFEYEVPSQEVFLQRFREITASFPWLVCQEGDQILGYAYGDRAFSRAAYSWCADLSVYLRPEAHRRGVGRALYTLLERMLALQGYQTLYGVITGENEASCRFHRAMGYEHIATMPNCGYKFDRWLSVCWYEKRLCPPRVPDAFPTPAPEMDWSGLSTADLSLSVRLKGTV